MKTTARNPWLWLALAALVAALALAARYPGTGGNVPDRPPGQPHTAPAAATAAITTQTPAQLAAAQANQATTITAGCVLRGDGGWHLHINATHYCDAVTGIHTEADGDLVVDLNNGEFGAVALKTQSVEEDEQFSKFTDCGPSGGLGTTTIRCWDKDNPGHLVRADDPRFNNPLGNLWFEIVWKVPTP
jgi:hypothetical protein